ncbi:hypothetical protein TREMEDRAFT_70072 [Tremella mesenterica DSM 1558]|uniref:uncharacterized protein n=1 Tax=Tremella mesenterica (strain ATCC 24925 / CBS 8224 / DSM 1558 / NBRC 9311 / NRRL Y-6157 / RJB 2259-6 / UBC 559-6) TaxID=578456 RepID=UPI00032CE1E7|nr:uncharacterized protein TREMEDRAFT_70072 [Tremella mesenterica DSM 1558]EIW66435.1 hypothetical protein TREMEDRAFT_70072 [Tremella mesenterica DSM 1558]
MSFLSRPSRSYANVQHNADGLSAVGTAPYSAPVPNRVQGGFKTYRPQLAAADQRAELDRILEPEFKPSSGSIYEDRDSIHSAGPSRLSHIRTAGGVSDKKGKRPDGHLRAAASLQNLRPGSAASGRRSGLGGVYVDANGRTHDTEYDPFAGVSAISRNKSKRPSAFGMNGRRHSSASSSSSDSDNSDRPRASLDRDGGHNKDEEEIRRKLELERRRLDEVSGYAAARRRSMVSDKSWQPNSAPPNGISGYPNGRATPSLRSYEDGTSSGHSLQLDRYAAINGARSRSSQGQETISPLSPGFAPSSNTSRGLPTTFEGDGEDTPVKMTESTNSDPLSPILSNVHLTRSGRAPSYVPPNSGSILSSNSLKPPEYSNQSDQSNVSSQKSPAIPKKKERIEVKKDGSVKITGFDAPSSPMPPSILPKSPLSSTLPGNKSSVINGDSLRVPTTTTATGTSIRSSSHPPHSTVHKTKPPERPREDLFPETPAQMKRREDRERRAGLGVSSSSQYPRSRNPSLAIDTRLASTGVARILPEIEIVEDDDPRIVFPPEGKTTRVQSVNEHAIRGPFGPLLHHKEKEKEKEKEGSLFHYNGYKTSSVNGSLYKETRENSLLPLKEKERTASFMSGGSSGMRDKSGVLDLDNQAGYLPSRWANGDKELRVTEDERERYRPREWGEVAGGTGEWKPSTKEQIKRNWKDVQTNARFTLFRAKKKLLRKAEL